MFLCSKFEVVVLLFFFDPKNLKYSNWKEESRKKKS